MATVLTHGANCVVKAPVKGNQRVALSIPLKVCNHCVVRLTCGNPGTHGGCSGDPALEVAVASAYKAAQAAAAKGRADDLVVTADASFVTFSWSSQKTGSAVRISLVEIIKAIGSACNSAAAAVKLASLSGVKGTSADSIKHALSAVAGALKKASYCTIGPANFNNESLFI